MNYYIFLAAIILLFSGCGNEFDQSEPYVTGATNQQPKYYGNKPLVDHKSVIESAKLKAENEKEIALINKERDITVEKIRQETVLKKSENEKEVAFKQSDTEVIALEHSVEMQKSYMALLAFVIFVGMLFLFYFLQKRRKDRLKIHEDILHKEMYMKDREIQAKMAERILDTLEKGKLSSEQESKLVETLSRNSVISPIEQIEHQDHDRGSHR